MSASAELHARRNAAFQEIREINQLLRDSQPHAVLVASKARILELEKLIPVLDRQRREQIVVENQPIVDSGEIELQVLRPEIDAAYRSIGDGKAADAAIAKANSVLARRDDLISRVRIAKLLIVENDPRISAGGFSESHPGRVKQRGVAA